MEAQMPNYSVWLSSEEAAPGRVAGFLVETLRRVYAVRPTDIFNFAPFHLFHGLLRGEYGPEFALNPGLTPAQRARAIRGIEFPRDLAPRM